MEIQKVKQEIKDGIKEVFENAGKTITDTILVEFPNSIELNLRPIKNYIEGDRSVSLNKVLMSSFSFRFPSDPEIKKVVEFRQNMYNIF